jgi:hypothetical protein
MKKILLLFALIISSVTMSQTTLTIGTSTSSSSSRGPFSRSSSSSSSVFARSHMLYSATELSSISSNAVISQVNFDLGSTNVITATGNATLMIYMKNSSLTAVSEDTNWNDAISGATLVGTYTFNTTNNFPGAKGFMSFTLDTNFNYTAGSALEIAIDWDSSSLVSTTANANELFSGDGSLKWHWSSTAHSSFVDRTGSSSAPSTLTGVISQRVNTQIIHASADPSADFTESLGSGTSSSATRGPFQRSSSSSSSVFSRSNMVYTATELASLSSNALISKIDFDLGSTNIINATGDATLKIYMKNSSATEAVADGETWANVISGAVLVGSYTFNTTNNFPGSKGFYTFNLDTDFEYTGGSLEVSVDWDCSELTSTTGNANELFTGDGSLNWNWDNTTHISLNYQTGSSSAPSSLNKASNRKTQRANTKFTFKKITSSAWDGSTNTDWNTGDNWSTGFVPSAAVTVTIGSTGNNPVISSSTGAETHDLTISGGSLTIQSGGSLISSGTTTGDITYNVSIPDANWHMVSSPVSGETYDDAWVTANSIASGSTNSSNRGIAMYQNGTPDGTTGPWIYMQGGASGTFGTGTGYSMIATGATTYGFTGTYPTLPNSPTITQDVNNWNLVGNPATAYIDVAAYITANAANIEGAFQALYVYNGSTYTGLTSGYIHPGQAFFVSSNIASGTVSTTAAMLSHQTGVTFYKSGNTSINLSITDGNLSSNTSIEYMDNSSLGLDPGKDLGKFNGVNSSLNIYTNLIENNEGIAFEKQTIPSSAIETIEIPVGVKAMAGKEITISASSINLPEGINVFLEDRELNEFSNLNDANYKIVLDKELNGEGRFYLHTSSKSALTVDDNLVLSNISIYKANESTIRIVGLQQGKASFKLYNVLGKQIITSSFEANGVKDISLPNLSKGVYIVQLETASGNLNKKIVLE